MTTSASASDDRGRRATSPWQMPAKGWRDILLRTWKEASKDNIGLIAAGVTYYSFLAIVPMLGATVLSYGLVASPRAVLAHMADLTRVLPQDAARLIGEQLLNVVETSRGKKGFGVLVALAIALFGARNAAGSVIIALNVAYEEEEKRGFLKVTALALGITAAAVVLALLGVAAIGAVQLLGRLLPQAPAIAVLGKLVVPLLLGVGAAAAAAALYRYGPSRERAKWVWLTPGSLFAAVAWLLVTTLFGVYVTRFAHFDTYGSIGGAVAMMTWMFLSSYVFLFGAELNSEIEHQTAADTTHGNAQPMGTRGAWSADHVASGPDDEGREAGDGAPSPSPPSDMSAPGKHKPDPTPAPPREHPYVASRVTSRATQLVGIGKIGTATSVLSTLGLALLRKPGRARAGAALVAMAVGLSLLRRHDDH